jgi:hypothetical protein
MKTDERERIFLERVRGVLKQDIENLDRKSADSLRQMRRNALDRRERNQARLWKRLRVPAAALATLSIILLVVGVHWRSPVDVKVGDVMEDMEILASNDRLDMYIDLDFYEWLVWEEKNAG